MPLIPENAPESGAVPPADRIEPEGVPRSRLASVSFVAVALVAGILLVMLPWSDAWNANSVQRLIPVLRGMWNDPYFRGGVTGLGVVNIYFACLEIARLRKIP